MMQVKRQVKSSVERDAGVMVRYVGKVLLDDTFYPGWDLGMDGAEDEILEVVSSYPEEAYARVIGERKKWELLYHLSHVRQNLVEWLPITKEQGVLEIGAGCGVFTGVLADKAKSVRCIEASGKRSLINATRYQKREKIEIWNWEFQKAVEKLGELNEQYDWIVLTEGLAGASACWEDMGEGTRYTAFLRQLGRFLKKDGRLVFAADNRLGLKYFAGCAPEGGTRYFEGIEGWTKGQDARSFSRPELEKICRAAGFEDMEFYYPYPDRVLPMSVYSDAYLPKAGELRDNRKNFDRERYILFDEARAFDRILEDGLFPVFANAFLVIARQAGQ